MVFGIFLLVKRKFDMTKKSNQKHNDVEDYLTQVEWQNKQSQRPPGLQLPWYMEPKWKYKRVSSLKSFSEKAIPVPVRILITIIVLGIGYLLYKNALGLLILLLGMGTFFFFMMRDASKKPKDDDNN